MKINLQTIFDVGDTVYFPELYSDYWYPSDPAIVTEVSINITSSAYTNIKYYVTDPIGARRLPVCESYCFATYEECAKWCHANS